MPAKRNRSSEILKTARERLGFESLRPGQEDAVRSLLEHRDTVVVQPTGSGKSAIYQIAGVLIEGSTVVVSPLIALQKDQVDSINQSEAPEAVLVNSAQKVSDLRNTMQRIEDGEIEYIFLAPEQLAKPETVEKLKAAEISLFVIDEAHCISEWGHDFRPDYLHLGPVIEQLGHPTVLAMTATASPEVRAEIIQRLGLRDPKVFVQGFDRPNIFLRVDTFQTEQEKTEALIRRISFAEKPGIVYVATRKKAEEIMGQLHDLDIPTLFYHGGLRAKERDAIQERFMQGDATDVIVATNAFGMGVDKANIRFVYHYDVSDSLDSYYQEIGRAGRDGEPSEAVLFYRPENIGIQKFRSGEGKLEPARVEQVVRLLSEEDGPVDPAKLEEQTNLSKRKLASTVHRLEDVGALETLPTGEVQLTSSVDPAEVAHAAVEEQERHKDVRRERLKAMQEYAELTTCRREFMLRYFGDDYTGSCHHCDNCEAGEGIRRETSNTGQGTRREVA